MQCPKCGEQFGWSGMVSAREHVRQHRELALLKILAQTAAQEIDIEDIKEMLLDLNKQSGEMMMALIVCASSFKLHELITN